MCQMKREFYCRISKCDLHNYIMPPVIILYNLGLILFNTIDSIIQYTIIISGHKKYSNTTNKTVLGNIALNNFLKNVRLNS